MTPVSIHRSGLHQAFVATVFALGCAALVDALFRLGRSPAPPLWILLALLAVASDALSAVFDKKMSIPGLTAHVSPSEIFLFLIVLWFGDAPAIATVSIGGLAFRLGRELHKESERRKNRELKVRGPWWAVDEKAVLHAAFDLAEPALSVWVAAAVYVQAGGAAPIWTGGATLAQDALPALALAAAYFAMNGGLIAIAEATGRGQSPFPVWRQYLRDVSVNYFSNASIAVILAVNLPGSELPAGLKVLAVVAPLVLTPYYSLLEPFRRLKDQDSHVKAVEALTDELVETLGMTAEAQDPVSALSHIRRVRKTADRLADRMGITDPLDRRAVSYAGLLHDYGKTKIPAHILHKPGKLTESEFEIVKTHTSLGADMISRIGFNLPLAPLVRHHHENWDGTGYPDRIRGEAIPLGARILSVADCYDALRERRRYRLGMTHEQAMAIIRERAGTMYDPAVVRALESIEDDIRFERYDEPAAEPVGVVPSVASAAPADNGTQPLPIEVRVSGTDTLVELHEALSGLDPAAGVNATCELVTRHLLRLAPASLVVFYRRDEAVDEMVAVFASGFGEALARATRMPLGDRVTGWVGAYGCSVINQNAELDLDERLNEIQPRFRSLLSVPLALDGAAVGVVTLYASRSQAFREDQRLALELISQAVAEAFDRAMRVSGPARLESNAAGAPSQTRHGVGLSQLLASDRGSEPGRARAVLCVRNAGDATVMLHATMAVSKVTRVADLIFRSSGDALVVLMNDSDASVGHLMRERIAAALPADIVPPTDPSSPLRVGFACSPYDGHSWIDLLGAAERRLDQSAAGAPPVLVASGAAERADS